MARGSERAWWWVFGPMLGLAAALAGGWWWIISDADWQRAQQRAAALGIPITEHAIAQAYDSRTAGDLAQAVAAAKALVLPDNKVEREWREDFRLLGAHQREKLEALDALVDGLPEHPILGAADPWVYDRLEREIVVRVLAARIVFCPREELVGRIRRAARFNVTNGSVWWWRWSFGATTLVSAVAARLPDLRGDAEAAAALEAALDRLTPICRANIIAVRAHEATLLRDATDPYALFRTFGIQMPQYMEFRPAAMVAVRWQREAELDAYTRTIDLLGRHPDPKEWPQLFPRGSLQGGLFPFQHDILGLPRQVAQTLLRGRVVLAELRGEPWPQDWFDPAGQPLRRIEREGRLIGAYSVGNNAVDDGGIRGRDDCQAFAGEELGQAPARAADRPPAKRRMVRVPRYAGSVRYLD